jgi:hypothetical protein
MKVYMSIVSFDIEQDSQVFGKVFRTSQAAKDWISKQVDDFEEVYKTGWTAKWNESDDEVEFTSVESNDYLVGRIIENEI